MRPLAIFVVILTLIASEDSRGADGRLRGCPDPNAIVNSLAQLRDAHWREVSLARVEAIWPTQLRDLGCESKEGCILAGSKGRIINGHCECCETFEFDVRKNEDGSRSEQLDGIIIFYSSPQRKGTVDVAKRLAKASGLGEAEVSNVGREQVQSFQWNNSQKSELFVLELKFWSSGPIWTLHIAIGRHDISK